MDITTCKHEYKEVVTKSQEAVISRHDYEDHLIGKLEKEEILIFCIHCGNTETFK